MKKVTIIIVVQDEDGNKVEDTLINLDYDITIEYGENLLFFPKYVEKENKNGLK